MLKESLFAAPMEDSCVGPYVVDLAVCASACCFTAGFPEAAANHETRSCHVDCLGR